METLREIRTKLNPDTHMVITKHGKDDWSVWVGTDLKDDTNGASSRGTKKQIFQEVEQIKEWAK